MAVQNHLSLSVHLSHFYQSCSLSFSNKQSSQKQKGQIMAQQTTSQANWCTLPRFATIFIQPFDRDPLDQDSSPFGESLNIINSNSYNGFVWFWHRSKSCAWSYTFFVKSKFTAKQIYWLSSIENWCKKCELLASHVPLPALIVIKFWRYRT